MALKTRLEIDELRRCAELVSKTLGEVARHVEPGISACELDLVAERFILGRGAVPAFKGYRIPGLPPFPGTLCVSVNDVVVHGIPDGYVLQDGDLVSVDCGVRYRGFYGDSAYTFAVGDVDEKDEALRAITREALNRGIAEAYPGRRIGDIGHAIQTCCESRGYGVVRELTGHGIGRQLHEEPEVPNVGRPRAGAKLRPGHVFCVEPMINRGSHVVRNDRNGWPVRTSDGAASAHFEHMVALGSNGPEVLTTFAFIEDHIPVSFTHVAHG